MELDQFLAKAETLTYIKPYANCKCGSYVFEIGEVEPLQGRDVLETKRRCIVECKACGRKFLSDWD